MPGSYKDKDVACPFYKGITHQAIRCEGVAVNTTTQINFADSRARDEYMATSCCRVPGYYGCVYASAMLTKYAEEEEIDE